MIELLAAAGAHGMETSSPVLQTLAISIVAGVGLVLISRRIGISAIVLLLIGGVLLGPQALGWVQPEKLKPTLTSLISLAVGLILFEGGLTLNLQGYKSASATIRRLLTLGVIVTWFGTAGFIWLFFHDIFGDRPIAISFLAASLVIVTGPTVIAPLLRRIRVKQNLHDILHWEGVLIDPIGVFIAVLTFEYIAGAEAGEAVGGFLKRVIVGLALGAAGGFAGDQMLRRRWIPDESINIFGIALALLIFDLCDYLAPESGLLGVTVAGLILGWRKPGPLKQIKEFKAEITDLLIGTLFIVLAAQLQFDDFARFGLSGLALVLCVVFIIRPLSVFLCSLGTPLTVKERIFLSYVAPRGIVAASMASLFALTLAETEESAWFLVTFTFSVIGFTVILQGSTAGLLAKALDLKLPEPDGWLIIGAHPFARRIAGFIRDRSGVDVVLLDANRRAVQEAREEGFTALMEDAREDRVIRSDRLRTIGNVLALTDNEELNVLICQQWTSIVGRTNVFRWSSDRSAAGDGHDQPGIVVWRNLPKPSLIAAELLRHEVHLMISEGSVESSGEGQGLPLLTAGDREAFLDPSGRKDEPTRAGVTLMMRRDAEYLQRSLRPDLITILEGVEGQHELFRELVDKVTSVEPRIDREAVIQELIEREKSFPTALGHGVAVPHAYAERLDRRMCVIARIPAGIDFAALDGKPVHLVFLLLSPQGDPEGHLATMGEIARLISDADARQRMIDAPDTANIIAEIESAAL